MTVAGGSAFDAPDQSAGFVLWRATLAWQRQVTAALAPLGLTHVQFVLLACAWWLARDAPPRQSDVAAQAGTDPVMTSEVLRRLEAKGLVERRPDPADRRARRVGVTAAGARLAEHAVAVVEGVDRSSLATLDAGALRGLASVAGL